MRAMGRRRGFLGFFMGVLVGILLVVAAVGGTAWWFYANFNLNKLKEWGGPEIIKGEDPDGIQQKNVKELISYITELSQNAGSLTLSDVKTKFGINIPEEIGGFSLAAIMNVKLSELPQNLNLLLDGASLRSLSDTFGFALPNIKLINDIAEQPITTAFNSLSSALDPNTQTLGTVCVNFGITMPDDAIFAKLKDVKLADFGNIQDTVMSMKVGELFPAQDGIMYALRDCALNNIQAGINDLALQDVITIDASSGTLLNSLKGVKISELATSINDLSLKQVMEIPATGILHAVSTMPDGSDTKISELGERMNTLTVGEMFSAECSDPNSFLHYIDPNTTVNNFGDGVTAGVKRMTVSALVQMITGTPIAVDSVLYAFKDMTLEQLASAKMPTP